MNPPTTHNSQAKTTKVWPWIAVPVALICALIYLGSVRERSYVGSLYGPYQGLDFTGELPAAAESELKLKSGDRLSIYVVPDDLAPVLVLWSAAGEMRWSRLMVPAQRYADGSVKQAWLRDLKLHKVRRSDGGFVVDITCDWEIGGKESGRLYLDQNYRFKDFKLSW